MTTNTAATLPVHKVIYELPQVDRAVHLPSNSVFLKRLVPLGDPCVESILRIPHPPCQALSSELGTSPLDATVFASKLWCRWQTSSKQQETLLSLCFTCLHKRYSIPPAVLKGFMNEWPDSLLPVQGYLRGWRAIFVAERAANKLHSTIYNWLRQYLLGDSADTSITYGIYHNKSEWLSSS